MTWIVRICSSILAIAAVEAVGAGFLWIFVLVERHRDNVRRRRQTQ
jgi:hypothetical protein